MVTSTPFSDLLHQLVNSSSQNASVKGKGKGKASSTASSFFTATLPKNESDKLTVVDEFCKLVEQYDSNDGSGIITSK